MAEEFKETNPAAVADGGAHKEQILFAGFNQD
jgi:hypothetical protein